MHFFLSAMRFFALCFSQVYFSQKIKLLSQQSVKFGCTNFIAYVIIRIVRERDRKSFANFEATGFLGSGGVHPGNNVLSKGVIL